ncbi:hypothetical protein OL548_29935 [Lysinibacillus sp. MHQ-1]|nr:hypothetical protein OL548_29935 [Lysinibacillus sp. MHQ-1]
MVILALDDDLGISQERLRKAAADFYKLTVSKEPPKIARVSEQLPLEETGQKNEGSGATTLFRDYSSYSSVT